jgi:tetratricopeptide (TPR) repeat protein
MVFCSSVNPTLSRKIMKSSFSSLGAALLLVSAAAFAQPAPQNAQNPTPNAQRPAPNALPPLVQKAAAAFNRGMLRQNEKRYAEAIAAYKEFLVLGKQAKLPAQTLLPAHQNLATMYSQQNKRKELEAELRQIVAVKSDEPFALAQLAAFAVEKRKYAEAARFANKALALKPAAPIQAQAHYALGMLATAKRDATGAEKSFGQAAKLAPDNPQAHYSYGLALATRKQYDAAIKAMERATTLAPNFPAAWLALGGLKQEKSDFFGALAAYDALLKFDKKNLVGLYGRAYALQRLSRTNDAIKAYRAYLDAKPNPPDPNVWAANFNLGELYLTIENNDAALIFLSEAAKLNPKNARVWMALAYAQTQIASKLPVLASNEKSPFDAAETSYNKALALAPNDPTILDGLAAMYEKANRADDALMLNNKRIKAEPKNIAHRYRQARIHSLKKDAAAIYQTWEEYRLLVPEDIRGYAQAAQILEAQGKFAEANAEWNLWMAKHPNDAQALLATAQNLSEMNQPKDAEAQYKKVLALDRTAENVKNPQEKPAAIAAAEAYAIEALRGLALLAQSQKNMDAAIDYWHQTKTAEFAQAKRTDRSPNPATFRALAAAYERANKPELALIEFQNMAAQFPKDGTPFADIARLLESLGKLDEAADALRKGAERTKDPLNFRLQIAEMYRRNSKFEQALAVYENLRKDFPKDTRPLGTMAQLYEQTGNDDKALAIYDALLKADATQTWISGKRAQIFVRSKRWNEAKVIFEKEIARNPNDYQVYADLGNVHKLEGNPDGYLAFLKGQLEKFPFRRTLMMVLLDQYTARMQEEAGWTLLRETADKHSKEPLILEAYANVLAERKKDAEALTVWRKIAALNPKDIPAHRSLITALDKNNQGEEATALLQTLSERADFTPEQQRMWRVELANRYVGQNRKEDAVKLYERILKQTPDDVQSTTILANLYTEIGRETDAIPLLKSLRDRPAFAAGIRARIALRIGELLEKQGKKPEALTEYRTALRFDPNVPDAAAAIKRLENKG